MYKIILAMWQTFWHLWTWCLWDPVIEQRIDATNLSFVILKNKILSAERRGDVS